MWPQWGVTVQWGWWPPTRRFPPIYFGGWTAPLLKAYCAEYRHSTRHILPRRTHTQTHTIINNNIQIYKWTSLGPVLAPDHHSYKYLILTRYKLTDRVLDPRVVVRPRTHLLGAVVGNVGCSGDHYFMHIACTHTCIEWKAYQLNISPLLYFSCIECILACTAWRANS
jgi:hypothetical protein